MLLCVVCCRVEDNIRVFMEDPDSEATLDVGPDMRKINLCFSLLKVAKALKFLLKTVFSFGLYGLIL